MNKPIWIIENIAKESSYKELATAVKNNNLELLIALVNKRLAQINLLTNHLIVKRKIPTIKFICGTVESQMESKTLSRGL